MNLRHPRDILASMASGLWMYAPYPISIEIKPIVIRPTIGPRRIMVYISRLDSRNRALHALVPVDIAVSSIGVNAYIEYQYAVVQYILSLLIFSSSKSIAHLQRRLRARCFIAMDVIAVGYEHGLISYNVFRSPSRDGSWVAQLEVGSFELIDIRQVLG